NASTQFHALPAAQKPRDQRDRRPGPAPYPPRPRARFPPWGQDAMREPRAIPTTSPPATAEPRAPRAFETTLAEPAPDVFEATPEALADTDVAPAPTRRGRFWRNLAVWTGGTLVCLGLGLAAERLVRDLFATYDWLGWFGLVVLAIFVVALIVLTFRELIGLARLRTMDRLRERAAAALLAD